MLPTSLSTPSRSAGVGKTVLMAAPMINGRLPRRPAAMMNASRESRIVLP